MIDFHSHILPNVDDGSASIEETISMLENARNEGSQYICATSHYIEGDFPLEKDIYEKKYREVLELGDNIGIRVVKGLEVYLTPNLVRLYEENKIIAINEKRYMLIELPMREFPIYTEDVLYELRIKGITPIIAHPERNVKIANNADLLVNLVAQGNLAQINAGSLMGFYGETIKKVSEDLVKRNLVHLIGSDGHNSSKRNTFIKDAYLSVKKLNLDLYNWILENEEKVVLGQEVNPLSVLNIKKGFISRLFGK